MRGCRLRCRARAASGKRLEDEDLAGMRFVLLAAIGFEDGFAEIDDEELTVAGELDRDGALEQALAFGERACGSAPGVLDEIEDFALVGIDAHDLEADALVELLFAGREGRAISEERDDGVAFEFLEPSAARNEVEVVRA